MDFNAVEIEIELLRHEAEAAQVTSEKEMETANGNAIVCAKMKVEMQKFVDALAEANKAFNQKIAAYKKIRKENPAPPPALTLDDFDDEAPSFDDELATEIKKSTGKLF